MVFSSRLGYAKSGTGKADGGGHQVDTRRHRRGKYLKMKIR